MYLGVLGEGTFLTFPVGAVIHASYYFLADTAGEECGSLLDKGYLGAVEAWVEDCVGSGALTFVMRSGHCWFDLRDWWFVE
jgi:hypothetical protein